MHDTHTLRQVCLQDPYIARYFLDVYGADQVECRPITQYPCCAIVNTDPIRHPGQHWVSVYWYDKDTGEFFDSYAEQPSTLYPGWQCWDSFSQVLHPLQAWTSDVCGDYCLYFLYKRCRGVPLRDIVSYFDWKDVMYNDQAVLQRMHDLFPRRLSKEPHRETPRQYCIVKAKHDVYKNKA